MSSERTLKCINSKISSIEWTNALLIIDEDIMTLHDKSSDIIIISSPFQLKDIKQSITEFITTKFEDESLLNCFDVVIDFIIPNKKYIENKIESKNDDMKNKKNKNKWNMDKYDELLSTQSIIVINTINCDYISIPRYVKDLQAINYKHWTTSWDQMDSDNFYFSEVNDRICDNIANNIFSMYTHFELSKKIIDWTKKIDFQDVTECGYLCDDGQVIKAEILRQKPGKVFVHFEADNYGKRYEWITVPNVRLCAAPISFNGAWRHELPRSRSEEDDDLQRALAASLGHTYNNMHHQVFEEQEEVTYNETLDILLNNECCLGIYDENAKKWRTGVYMNHWDKTQKIMIRYLQQNNLNQDGLDKFCSIKDFPVNCISKDYQRFNVTERDLRDMSNIPKEFIHRWLQRKKQNK